MLQQLLKGIVPNYEQLQQEQMKFVKSIGLFKAYKSSSRYDEIRKHIEKYSQERENVCLLSDLIDYVSKKSKLTESESKIEAKAELKSGNIVAPLDVVDADLPLEPSAEAKTQSPIPSPSPGPSPSPLLGLGLEVCFILDKLNYFNLDINGQIHVVNSEDEEGLSEVLAAMRNKLSAMDIIKLISWTLSITNEVERSGLSLRKLPFLENSKREQLIDHLIEIGDFATTKKIKEKKDGPDSDSDSDSESETETDSESSWPSWGSRDGFRIVFSQNAPA
jgi:hypothetical protein